MHEIRYKTFKDLQATDEARQTMGDFKLMPWLTTKIHMDRTGFSRMRCAQAGHTNPPAR